MGPAAVVWSSSAVYQRLYCSVQIAESNRAYCRNRWHLWTTLSSFSYRPCRRWYSKPQACEFEARAAACHRFLASFHRVHHRSPSATDSLHSRYLGNNTEGITSRYPSTAAPFGENCSPIHQIEMIIHEKSCVAILRFDRIEAAGHSLILLRPDYL